MKFAIEQLYFIWLQGYTDNAVKPGGILLRAAYSFKLFF